MDKFLERCKLPTPTKEKINNQNSSIAIKEIKNVVKNLPIKKTPGPNI